MPRLFNYMGELVSDLIAEENGDCGEWHTSQVIHGTGWYWCYVGEMRFLGRSCRRWIYLETGLDQRNGFPRDEQQPNSCHPSIILESKALLCITLSNTVDTDL
jgi:hypothetical protein